MGGGAIVAIVLLGLFIVFVGYIISGDDSEDREL